MKIWLAPQLQNGTRFVPQCDGDLGRRLATVVRREFDNGSERIYLIGGDCPALSLGGGAIIALAFLGDASFERNQGTPTPARLPSTAFHHQVVDAPPCIILKEESFGASSPLYGLPIPP
jgi:Uncharacterized protein conserved in bacteria (DUF2064)